MARTKTTTPKKWLPFAKGRHQKVGALQPVAFKKPRERQDHVLYSMIFYDNFTYKNKDQRNLIDQYLLDSIPKPDVGVPIFSLQILEGRPANVDLDTYEIFFRRMFREHLLYCELPEPACEICKECSKNPLWFRRLWDKKEE